MALYVIDINEKSEKGKQLKRLLIEKQSATKVFSIKEYEKNEELALMKIMSKPLKEELVTASQIRASLAKAKKRVAK